MIPGSSLNKKANPILGDTTGNPMLDDITATGGLNPNKSYGYVPPVQKSVIKSPQIIRQEEAARQRARQEEAARQRARQEEAAAQQKRLEEQLNSGRLTKWLERYKIPYRIVPMNNTPYGNQLYYNYRSEAPGYYPVNGRSDIHGVIVLGGDPLENMNKLVNPTNNAQVRKNLAMQDRERHKARAQSFGVPYEPGKRYFFNYNVPGLDIPTRRLPSILDTGKPATYFIVPGAREYADDSVTGVKKSIGVIAPDASLKQQVHEGWTGTGHRGTAGNFKGGTQSTKGKVFTSAGHGDAGSREFKWDRPGSEPPYSYFNSIVENTGLVNRMKILSGASDTPATFIEFNRADPGYKIKPNEAGGYNIMDWLERQGVVSWNPKTNQYDYTDKMRPETIPQRELSEKLNRDFDYETNDKLFYAVEAIRSLAPEREINAFIQQVNRIYYLQDRARKGVITEAESKELDRAAKILKHNVRLSNNRTAPSIPGYTYNPTVVG